MEDKKHSFMDQLNLFFVFRIVKNTSKYVDCSMCNLYLSQQREWCKYCINGFYCKLVKKHKG